MKTQKLENLKGMKLVNPLPSLDNLYYPEAIEWMWSYCVYLDSAVDEDGTNVDIGIYIKENERISSMSLAIVHNNKPGSYISGLIKYTSDEYLKLVNPLLIKYFGKGYEKYILNIKK